MSKSNLLQYQSKLKEIQANNRVRSLKRLDGAQGPKIQIESRSLLNFSSNDYLGLTYDSIGIEAAQEAASIWGVGSGASRLVSGSLGIHHALEEAIADFKREESALIFSSGYQANLGVIPALMDSQNTVYMDRYCHASLVDGIRLSGAKLKVYPHLDLERLEGLLTKESSDKTMVVTDSYFSMDGDCAPLASLVEICQRHSARLMVDEAHATGIWGATGRGLTEQDDVEGQVDIVMGTFSKALGSQGGFVCGPKVTLDYILQRAKSFIYSTGPSPMNSAAALAAIQHCKQNHVLRLQLWKNVEQIRSGLLSLGLDLLNSKGPIIPLVIGETSKAIQISKALMQEGIYIPCIRPPTVPKGTDRLRITVTAKHQSEHIDSLIQKLKTLL